MRTKTQGAPHSLVCAHQNYWDPCFKQPLDGQDVLTPCCSLKSLTFKIVVKRALVKGVGVHLTQERTLISCPFVLALILFVLLWEPQAYISHHGLGFPVKEIQALDSL